jgi:hypothetical protein
MFKEEDSQNEIKLHDKIGSFTVVEFMSKSKRTLRLKCTCGEEVIAYYSQIKRGNIKYCKNKNCTYKEDNNFSREIRLYNLYKYAKNICYNENHPNYKEYLFMCDEWRIDFLVFKKWAYLHGYTHNKVMNLKSKEQGYTPANVEWITRSQYAIKNNKQKQYLVRDNKTLGELCREKNINYRTVYQRVNILKWDLDRALNTPIHRKKKDK